MVYKASKRQVIQNKFYDDIDIVLLKQYLRTPGWLPDSVR